MSPLKVAVIGGGSTYSPELVSGFLERRQNFPLEELWLMDIDPGRLEVVGGLAQRMAAQHGNPFRVVLTTNSRQAVAGAQYVITQLRVGQMAARRADEYLGLVHGLIGQETTGVGGMAKALRTIPVILRIANEMHELAAPQALLVNFTNPAGLVTQALAAGAPHTPSVGVCNVPITTKMHILEGLSKRLGTAIEPERADLDTLGLNHLSWHRGFTVDGEDLWPQVLEAFLSELRTSKNPEWEPDLIESLRMIPNDYLQYFYYTGRKMDSQKQWPPSRAEEVMEIEKELLAQYADPALTSPPEGLMKRGGAYYSTMATQLLNAHYNQLDETHIVNVPQRGAVPGWPEDWVMEMPCRVGAADARSPSGIQPLPAEPLPTVCFGLLAHVKAYELLIVQAALHGDRQAAYQALLAHPLGPSPEHIQVVLDEMLESNRPYLPQFWD